MLKRLVFHLLERRHYWRYVDFGELAELYVSRMLRILAVSMVIVLVGIYLYQNGYSLVFIMGYYACFYLLRAILVFPSAFIVARIGPKHSSLISNILSVLALPALTQLDTYGLSVLIVFAFFQALSVSIYDVSYLVNFSKVKKDEHVGKELGFMFIIERVTASMSPIVGGIIAFIFGPEATMIFASGIFLLAAVPLLLSAEPTTTHQKITFRHFNWKYAYKGLIAHAVTGADYVASGIVWFLFLAIAIFGTTSNAVYAQIGALSSVTIVASLLFAKAFGIIIDRRRGGELLKFGVIANSLIHIARTFVSTPLGAIMINVTNEAATTAYSMPFTKGMFASADDLPGYRIVYLSLMTVTACLGASAFAATLSVIALFLHEVATIQVGYIIIAAMSLLMLRHGFPALRSTRFS